MKKTIILAILSIFYCGCSTSKISGIYSGVDEQSFILKKDSTFIYWKFNYEARLGYSEGHWKKVSTDEIILNSNIKNKILPILINESESSDNKNHLILNVDGFNGRISERKSDYRCHVYVNDILFKNIRCDSLCELVIPTTVHNIKLDLFHFGDILSPKPVNTDKLNLIDSTNKIITINVNIKNLLFGYRIFDNQTIYIKRNIIKFYDKETNKLCIIPRLKRNKKLSLKTDDD
jgi:hypothetical protein